MKARNPLSKPRIWDYGFLLAKGILREMNYAFPRSGEILLDVGAGTQPYRHLYTRGNGRKVICIDTDFFLKPDIQADAEQIPIANESIDGAVMIACLCCVGHPIAALREISRVLVKGGFLVLADHQSWQQYGNFDKYHFTENGLKYLAAQAGFTVQYHAKVGSFWARVGMRVNRMILPFRDSPFSFLIPISRIFIIFSNLLFGLIDQIFQPNGETILHFLLLEKSGKANI